MVTDSPAVFAHQLAARAAAADRHVGAPAGGAAWCRRCSPGGRLRDLCPAGGAAVAHVLRGRAHARLTAGGAISVNALCNGTDRLRI